MEDDQTTGGIDVSVVVPTFNRPASLRRMLESLGRQTYPTDRFEVVVVDDGSAAPAAEALAGLETPFRLRVLRPPHGGPAEARNTGVDAATGTVVLFLDDDVSATPDLLAEHAAAHAGAADTVVIGPMSAPQHWPRPVWVRWGERTLERQYQQMAAGDYPCTWRQFYTANASLPRARFRQVGGFDTRFLRNEDVELAQRLDLAGMRFVFSPRAEVFHYAEHRFEAWRRATYQYGRYDVVMERDKGQRNFVIAAKEFHLRHRLSRRLAQACVGRGALTRAVVGSLSAVVRVADRLGAGRAGMLALSALSTILYWQGSCDEYGDRAALWHRVNSYAWYAAVWPEPA